MSQHLLRRNSRTEGVPVLATMLLVEWDSIEAHTEGFRGSEDYAQWRALLHHFYDPFPVVEHFLQVL